MLHFATETPFIKIDKNSIYLGLSWKLKLPFFWNCPHEFFHEHLNQQIFCSQYTFHIQIFCWILFMGKLFGGDRPFCITGRFPKSPKQHFSETTATVFHHGVIINFAPIQIFYLILWYSHPFRSWRLKLDNLKIGKLHVWRTFLFLFETSLSSKTTATNFLSMSQSTACGLQNDIFWSIFNSGSCIGISFDWKG